ncbi:MAG: tetratricopeptide repeat-containing glycosyltransferase family 2 protein, partial [Bacilli bacterium]
MKKLATISLCMIVKNEELVLERCLSSVRDIVDEIIVVDTGSTDKTKEIAATFADRLLDFEWVDDFAAARNFAFRQAKSDWILWLDADDYLRAEEREQWLTLKGILNDHIDAVRLPYVLSTDAEGNTLYSIVRNRLVRRARGFQWIGVVHEFLDVQGPGIDGDVHVYHGKLAKRTDRNLRIFKNKLEKTGRLAPRDMFYYGNELNDHGFYEEAQATYETFLNNKDGWIEDKVVACYKKADAHAAIQETEEQVYSLVRSFLYSDFPRAEACCKLGRVFFERGELKRAAYWYEAALRAGEKPTIYSVYHDPSAWSHLPHLQLTVIYDQLGEVDTALEHHFRALALAENNPSVLHNDQYFRTVHKRAYDKLDPNRPNL